MPGLVQPNLFLVTDDRQSKPLQTELDGCNQTTSDLLQIVISLTMASEGFS